MKLYETTVHFKTQETIMSFIDLAQERMRDVKQYGAPCVPHVNLGAQAGHTTTLFDDSTYENTCCGKPLIVSPLFQVKNSLGVRGGLARTDKIESITPSFIGMNFEHKWRGIRQIRPIIFDSIDDRSFYWCMDQMRDMILLTEVPYVLRVGR